MMGQLRLDAMDDLIDGLRRGGFNVLQFTMSGLVTYELNGAVVEIQLNQVVMP